MPIDSSKDIMVILISAGECVSCNAVVAATYRNEAVSTNIPAVNKCFLVNDTTAQIGALYKERFAFLGNAVALVQDSTLYSYYSKQLGSGLAAASGIIITDKAGAIKCRIPLKDPQILAKLDAYAQGKLLK